MNLRNVQTVERRPRTRGAMAAAGCTERVSSMDATLRLAAPTTEPPREQARACKRREGGIVIGSPYGDPIFPRRSLGTALRASQNACVLVEPVGSNLHPYPPNKRPRFGGLLCGGEGGIRTHVPGFPDHLISSQRRCDRFGTSPEGANCSTGAEAGTSHAEGRE